MKNKVTISILAFILLIVFLNIPIADVVTETGADQFAKLSSMYPNEIICQLDYMVTTGSGWVIANSTAADIQGKSAVLHNLGDPIFLSVFEDPAMAAKGSFTVRASNIKETVYEGESCFLVDVKRLYINPERPIGEKTCFLIRDLSVTGICKAFLGVLTPWFRKSV